MKKAKSFGLVQSPWNGTHLAKLATASAIVSLISHPVWASGPPSDDGNDVQKSVEVHRVTTVENVPSSIKEITPDNDSVNQNTQKNLTSIGATKFEAAKQDPSQKPKKPGDGQCDASKMLGKACQTTYDWIDNASLTNTLTQAAGGVTLGASGQVANIKAQNAGTQSAVMQASANTQQNAGMLQTTLGLGNAAMGAYQIMLSSDHKKYGKDLSTQLSNSEEMGGMSNSSGPNPKTLEKGINEQEQVQRASMMAGVKSVITGVQQTLSGALAIGAAKQAKDLAGKLQDASGSNYQLTSANPTDLTNTAGSTTAINPGTSTDPAVASTDGSIKANDVPSITPPINPDSTSGGPGSGPAAGSFQAGNPQAAPGGGGSPNIGVGSMSPSKADPEPSGPKMADSKSNTAYGQGGSGYAPGGGVSAEKSADLGFLANLLPKPQEETGKNDILDYGNSGRSPASMAPYSFLGKDVNIFQRISDRTAAKFKNGDVGG